MSNIKGRLDKLEKLEKRKGRKEKRIIVVHDKPGGKRITQAEIKDLQAKEGEDAIILHVVYDDTRPKINDL